jgi:CHAT domain-containing protein/tetratricopeptide (TPR) repeat protein
VLGQALTPIARAHELKAEAERQLTVDGERSLALADEICRLDPEEPRVQALGLLARADALCTLGRYTEATQAYEASAELFRASDDDVGWARTRIGATFNARHAGCGGELFAEIDEARQILARDELWLRLARLENNLGLLLAGCGRPADALAAHERALEAAARLQPRNELVEAEVLATLSVAYYQVDDYAAAEASLSRALTIFERAGQREFVARAQRNYARFAAGQGHYSKALAAVMPGRRMLLQVGRTDAAAWLGQVGVDCLIRLNRAHEAAELAASVAAEFEAGGGQVEAASTHTLQAIALARLGQDEAALAALERARTLFGGASWEAGPASVQLGRAVVLGETGRWQEALAEAETVRDELRRRGSVVRAVQADLVRARALRAMGQLTPAAEAARCALDLVRDRPVPWLSYHAWRLLGELACDAGDVDAALAALLAAIQDLERVQGRILTEYRASFLSDKSDVFERTVDLLLRKDDVASAFDLVERSRSRALVDALAGGLDVRIRPRTAEQSQLAEELKRLRREHDLLAEQPDTAAEVLAVEQRITRTLEELRLAGADDLESIALLQGRVFSPQAELEPGTALVEYFRLGADLAVFVMDGQTLRVKRLHEALPRLQRLEGALQLNLQTATYEPRQRKLLEPNARALLGRAYDVLLRPIADWLAAYDRIIVVPHGRLQQLPFGALHDGSAYVVERFEVSTAPSASSLSFCLRPRARDGQHMLVGAYSADGALPEAIEEARAVAALYGGSALLGEELSLNAFKLGAREADLIHLAAHGVARMDAPLFSHLRLADGQQTALDCFDLELDCALVTLSACESGRGVIAAGDEQIGLPRAFLYAGARAVLHSLWRIDDHSTRVLMERFYAELRSGRGKAAALRAAQLAHMRDGFTHPLLWAALTLVGDWR